MAKNSQGKRPCSICRKWFQPDVRQKGRQKTCGNPDCMNERHRRQCEKWNKKNKEYHKNNYLGKKIEKAEAEPHTESHEHLSSKRQAGPVLPCDIIENECGMINLIIVQYPVHQIMNQKNARATEFTSKYK